MATRPVFIAKEAFPFYEEVETEFDYYSGFSISQKQKSIKSLHDNYLLNRYGEKVLEISTKSKDELGVLMSAFNLKLNVEGKCICVERAFQGGKIFDKGGPFLDIYTMDPKVVKKDVRLKENGNVVGFFFNNERFGNEPKDFFYNWLYIQALNENRKMLMRASEYSAFTDIEFNPKKSLNCQAKTVALSVGLLRAGIYDEITKDKDIFLEKIYKEINTTYEQVSLFNAIRL